MNTALIIISVLLNCCAQLLMRRGMLSIGDIGINNIINNIVPMVTNLWLWGAMACYAVSIIIWMVVLSRVQVSYAYPFLSIGYIVAALCGYYFFNENLDAYRISGILVICIGVYLISRS